jgi:integrase
VSACCSLRLIAAISSLLLDESGSLTARTSSWATGSLGIAAGLSAKTLSAYRGHATITITLDRYGHLMPGSKVEARAMLDGYLDGSKS